MYGDDMYQNVFTRHMLSSNRDFDLPSRIWLMILLWLFFCFCFYSWCCRSQALPPEPGGHVFFCLGFAVPQPHVSVIWRRWESFFFDTVTNSATESITKVPRPGKFEMRLACRAHLLRWALTQGCGTKGQEILAALTHGLTVYVKFLTHVWKGQYLNTMYCIISQFRNRVIH